MVSDDDWDEKLPMEKIFKDLGMKRYHLSGLKEFTKVKQIEEKKETITTASSDVKLKGPLAIQGSSSSSDVQIKIENPELLEYRSIIEILRTGKAALEKIAPKALDLGSKLKQAKLKDSSLISKSENFDKTLKAMQAFMEEIRDFCTAADFVGHNETVENLKQMCNKADLIKEKCLVHQTGMKQNIITLSVLIA